MKTAIVLNSEFMGKGDDELGKKLISVFLKKMWARDDRPQYILLYNGAVKLLTVQGGCLDVLSGLADRGVELLACGTCINFYNIADAVKIGQVSNMEEIVDVMTLADKVITI